MSGIYSLKGTVKHYDWGGFSFIPALLNIENKEHRPFAEYWMGTHSLGISKVLLPGGEQKELNELASNLPYLLKVLDVKDMLSIQVHPSKTAAGKEFARENKEGIPLDSPIRNYKDDNHKPEMLVALSDFWLLHGFKPEKELVYTLLNVVELRELLPVFNQSGYAGLYQYIMELPQEEVNRILQPLINNIIPLYKEDKLDKADEDFWAARAALTFSGSGNIDRGIFSIYLFNLVQLQKGEALFQGAGLPHAYLEGQNVELMANSDNVLRGGLTTKHIDVKELLKHVSCQPTVVNILTGYQSGKNKKVFHTPTMDFQMSVFELQAGNVISFNPLTVEILLLTDGTVTVSDNSNSVVLEKGNPSAVVFPGPDIYLKTATTATVFRASLPVNSGE